MVEVGRSLVRSDALRIWRGVHRRMRPHLVRADDLLHRLAGLSVSNYERDFPVVTPLFPDRIEVLADEAFTASCQEVRGLTILDTPRLANLWTLSRMCDREGSFIEIGSFRGGGALHVSNGDSARRVIVCDSFEGFGGLHETLDTGFGHHMFTDTSRIAVEQLFTSRGRDALVIAGFFPQSAAGIDLGPLSFVHLDVDVFQATRDSLAFIRPLMTPRSMIVLDDFKRGAQGVDRAVEQFVSAHPDWLAFPLFPGQGLLLNRSWFDA